MPCPSHTIKLIFKLKRDSDRLPRLKKLLNNDKQCCKDEIIANINCIESNCFRCESLYKKFLKCSYSNNKLIK